MSCIWICNKPHLLWKVGMNAFCGATPTTQEVYGCTCKLCHQLWTGADGKFNSINPTFDSDWISTTENTQMYKSKCSFCLPVSTEFPGRSALGQGSTSLKFTSTIIVTKVLVTIRNVFWWAFVWSVVSSCCIADGVVNLLRNTELTDRTGTIF